jgi:subtilase family serine protease
MALNRLLRAQRSLASARRKDVNKKSTVGLERLEDRTVPSVTGFAHPDIAFANPNGHVAPLASIGGITPAQMQAAYGVSAQSNTGSGVTIAIVDAYLDKTALSDLNKFSAQWGLPQFNTSGGPTFTAVAHGTRTNTGWGQEESLDIEWAHAMAPNANIILEMAANNSNNNLFGAVDDAVSRGAHIISMSWSGGDSSSDSSLDSHFNKPGIAFFASSGDTGGAIGYPSTSPYVVSVGGTTLNLSNGNYSSESAWSSGGGGVSSNEALPGYQSAMGLSYSGRATPDVSMDANPNTGVYIYDSGYHGWTGLWGGTSLSAPMWAGLAADADQGRSSFLQSSTLSSRFDYAAAGGTSYSSTYYHDIISGSNGFAAGPGYDLATGLGTPKAGLITYLHNGSFAASPAIVATLPPTGSGQSSSQTFVASPAIVATLPPTGSSESSSQTVSLVHAGNVTAFQSTSGQAVASHQASQSSAVVHGSSTRATDQLFADLDGQLFADLGGL